MNSKAVKESFLLNKSIKNNNKLAVALSYIKEKLLYPVKIRYIRFVKSSKRAISYAKFGWNNYDWDMGYVYELMAFKLKRLYKCLENGHCVQKKEDMKALRQFTKIFIRLSRDRYDSKYYREHIIKWGKMPPFESKPVLDKKGKPTGSSEIVFKDRPNVRNAKQKKQELSERKKIYIKAEKDRCQDIDTLAALLKKHGRNWWD